MTVELDQNNSRSHTPTAEGANTDNNSDKDAVKKFMDSVSQQSPKAPDDAKSDAVEGTPSDTTLNHGDTPTSSDSPMSTVKKAKKNLGQEKKELKRNRASHNRLQSEFGWQMTLQAAKKEMPPAVLELEEKLDKAPNGDVSNVEKALDGEDKGETPPTMKKKLEPEPVSVEELKPPSIHRKDKSDTGSTSSKLSKNLAKKEFGWQLALQENVGSITSKSSKDLLLNNQQIDGLPNSQDDGAKTPSQFSLHSPSPQKPPSDAKFVVNDLDAVIKRGENGHSLDPSGSSSVQLATTPSASTLSPRQKREFLMPDLQPLPNQGSLKSRIDLEEQLRNPVRSEFGWQVGLASKSLTFPLSKPSLWTPPVDDPSTSEFGAFANNIATAAAQWLRGADWRDVGGSDGPSEPDIRTREPAEAGEYSCQLCFANLPVNDARGIEGCDHQYCLSCFQSYILEALSGETFPIHCPACDPEADARGVVTESSILASNLFPNDVERYYVLQLRARPVEVECPECRNVEEVSWISFNNRTWSSCSSCFYRWCKACHKVMLRGGGGTHVCVQIDAKEPRKKRKEAWKQPRFCPGCGVRSTTETVGKKSNAVPCLTRGCHCYFCYVCGGVMADGATPTDVRSAITAHNRANPACAPSKHECTIQ